MAAPTPGQAAFEAYSKAESETGLISIPWHGMSDDVHAWWEIAAQAVLNDAFPGLRREIRSLTDDLEREHAEVDRLKRGYADAVEANRALAVDLAATRRNLAESEAETLRTSNRLLLAEAERDKARDAVRKLLDLFGTADARRMRHIDVEAHVTVSTLERYAAEAGVTE